jgi:cell division protein FtsI/penicillin-binding protein 2
MISAMRAVVASEKGTGHRAAIEGLSIAMKTGTAGTRAGGGLECVILAFAPAEQPKIAFGMIAEDAGPAEFAGAKIAHDFLAALRPRL